jgi:hypothetical protein
MDSKPCQLLRALIHKEVGASSLSYLWFHGLEKDSAHSIINQKGTPHVDGVHQRYRVATGYVQEHDLGLLYDPITCNL